MPEKRLVLLGGGHSHILLLKKLGMRPIKGLITSLVTPDATMIYTGMLPGAIMGTYSLDEIQVDLVKLGNYSNSRVIFDYAKNINVKEKNVGLGTRSPIGYDILSIDIGINYKLPKIKGFEKFVVPVKPFEDFMVSWKRFLAGLDQLGKNPAIALIGAGAAGCELALAINFKLKNLGCNPLITLIDVGKVASSIPNKAQKKILGCLKQNDIKFKEHTKIVQVSDQGLQFKGGETLFSDLTISTAGGQPHTWLSRSGLRLDRGFVQTLQTLQSVSHDFVFASGDCSEIKGHPSKRAGVFAVKAAPILYQNLYRYLNSRELLSYTPQEKFLQALTLEGRKALIFRGNSSISGFLPWLYKDFVDRSFLKKFSLNSPMNVNKKGSDSKENQMLCGACGAKVGGSILDKVLKKLPDTAPIMTNNIGDDAAILNISGTLKVLTTDHLRKFCEDPWKMAKITAIHALGDIWAMGAKPTVVLSHITVPESSLEYQEHYLSEIISSANETFLAEGAHVVGGHTTKGSELMIGFTILGDVGKQPITIKGASPTDKVILTKPIGVGTILAGEMQGLAKGKWVKEAHEWMMRSQGQISRIIGQNATAMTDITGFGIIGHLMKICRESGVGVTLSLDQVPILKGALDLTLIGVRSTLFEENVSQSFEVKYPKDNIKWPLLFDPQTSGGLLAAIPEKDVYLVTNELKKYGFMNEIIGEFFAGTPEIRVT